jgi:hypothetical protein
VDSNHRPHAYQACALTAELYAPDSKASASENRAAIHRPHRARARLLLRKEVIQPHLPIRLPCYDFTPIMDPTFDGCAPKVRSPGFGCCPLSWCDGRCVQGPGTYSPRRADPRLLAIPASRRRVAACDPNYDRRSRSAPARALASRCAGHCSTCVAQDIRGMMI